MSDADYDKVPDTYRKFKARMLAKDPNWSAIHATQLPLDHMKEEADKI